VTDERERQTPIVEEHDIVAARKLAREAAGELGFGMTDVTRIVTAVSELARNVFVYGGGGMMCCRVLSVNGRIGLELVFEDQGPGIADIEEALQQGFTSGEGMGLGLPGARRLMDDMEIDSEPGRGTTITVRKWLGR